MDESLEGMAWLLAVLKGSTSIMAVLTGGAWPMQAPEGAGPPYAVVMPFGGADVTAIAGYRVMYSGLFAVRLWGYATQSDALTTAYNTADVLLQQAAHRITPDGLAEVLSCIRENPLVPQPDYDGNQLRIGIGGMYRLQVRSLSS